VHALPQQTPCSQNVELHSAGAAQVAPIGFLPQLPVMQVLGALQSPLPPQVVRQVPPVPHTYGSQVFGVAARQLPLPLHERAGVCVTPVHVSVAHIVPAAYRRQAPAPSHIPSVPQPGAPLSMH